MVFLPLLVLVMFAIFFAIVAQSNVGGSLSISYSGAFRYVTRDVLLFHDVPYIPYSGFGTAGYSCDIFNLEKKMDALWDQGVVNMALQDQTRIARGDLVLMVPGID